MEEELIARLRVVGRSGFRRSLTGATGSLRTFGGVAGMVTRTGLAALTAGLAAGTTAGFSYNKMIDAQRVSFTTLLGSQKAAAKFMGQIRRLALRSPILDPQSTGDAARLMLAYGINAKQALPWVKALGDMSAATGQSIQEVMPRAALAIGQIASKGKLQTQEMNQLAQSVGLSQKRIRKELGLTQEQFAGTFTPGNNISAAKALPAIMRAMEKQSGGAAKRLAKTTSGRLDQLREVFKMRMGALTRGTWNMVGRWAHGLTRRLMDFDPKAFLRSVRQFTSDARDAFAKGFKGGLFHMGSLKGMTTTAKVFTVVGASVKSMWTIVKGVASFLKAAFPVAVRTVVAVVRALGDAFKWTQGAIADVRGAFSAAMGWWKSNVTPVINDTVTILKVALAPVLLAVKAVMPLVAGAFRAGWAAIKAATRGAGVFVKGVVQGIGTTLSGLADVVRGVVHVIASLLRGDLGEAWKGVKRLFSGGFRALVGIVKMATAPFRAAFTAVFSGLGGIAKGVFSGLVGFFRDRINNLIDVMNFAIKAYNKIPLAPNIGLIGHVGGGGDSGGGGGAAPPPGSAGNAVRGTGGLPGGLPGSSGGNTNEGGRRTKSVSPAARIGVAPAPLGGRAALWHLTIPVQVGRRELGRAVAKITADDLARSGRGG